MKDAKVDLTLVTDVSLKPLFEKSVHWLEENVSQRKLVAKDRPGS